MLSGFEQVTLVVLLCEPCEVAPGRDGVALEAHRLVSRSLAEHPRRAVPFFCP